MAITIAGSAGSSTNGATTQLVTFQDPPAADGDLQYLVWGMQSTSEAADLTNNRSMTRVGAPFVAADSTIRVHGIWILPVPTKASMPANVQFSSTAASRKVAINALLRGVDLTTPVNIASTGYASTGTTARTITALTPTADGLALASFSATFASPNDHAISAAPAGWTLVLSYLEPVGGTTSVSRNIVHIYSLPVTAGVSTGACTLTYVGTPAQATGQMVIFKALGAVTTAPAQVTGLSATQSGTSAALAWTAPANGGSPITGYHIDRAPDAAGAPGTWTTLVANTGTTAVSYADTTVTTGTYWFRVSAINAVGTGTVSTAASVVINIGLQFYEWTGTAWVGPLTTQEAT